MLSEVIFFTVFPAFNCPAPSFHVASLGKLPELRHPSPVVKDKNLMRSGGTTLFYKHKWLMLTLG